MILEQVEELAGLCTQLQKRREAVQHTMALQQRLGLLTEWQRALALISDFAETYKARTGRGVEELDRLAADRMFLLVRQVTQRFEQDPTSFVHGDLFAAFRRELLALGESLRRSAASAWKRYADEHAPAAHADLFEIFRALPRYADATELIRRRSAQLRLLRDKPLPTAAEFNDFDQLASQLRQAWEELGSDDLPDEVLEFLRGTVAERGGAPLELATPTVLEWLRNRGMLTAFRVRAV